MPSYQDYVVARDDHDPNRPASSGDDGSSRAGGDTGQIGGKKSRVVRMRTFLVGNLDRGTMNGSSGNMVGGSSGSTVRSVSCAVWLGSDGRESVKIMDFVDAAVVCRARCYNCRVSFGRRVS